MPHPIRRMQHLFEDYNKKITNTFQLGNLHHPWKFIFLFNNPKKRNIGTLNMSLFYIIFANDLHLIVVIDLRNDFEINAALE